MQELTLAELDNKKVLVRLDLDLSDQELLDPNFPRLTHAIPTLKYILEKNTKVIIISHRGRPSGVDPKFSLEPLVPVLSKLLNSKVGFVSSWGSELLDKALEESQIVLTENLRFNSGEEENDFGFAQKISGLGDLYVFEAFGVAHREHASVVSIPKMLPTFVGFNLEKEIKTISQIKSNPKRPLGVVIGGAKLETKLGVITEMLKTADWVVVGGKLVEQELPQSPKLVLPLDVVVGQKQSDYVNISTREFKDFPSLKGYNILDLGMKTLENILALVNSAGTVVWNGPLGYYEDTRFSKATFELAKGIAESDCFSMVGGGETLDVVERLGLGAKFDHLSIGGGAMLDYLAFSKLAFLEVVDG